MNRLQQINNSLQAMDIEESDNAVLSSPVSLNPMVCQQNGAFSLEDLAWVDSCLNKDSDISETDWSPFRDALFEIITSRSQSFRVHARQDNDKNITSQSSTSNANCLQNLSSAYNVDLIRMANGTSTDEILEDDLAGTTFQGDPFLPTYNEDLKPTYEMEHASVDNIFQFWDLNSANDEMEEASENIFKVWDLDIQVEEGELVKQLTKALSGNSFKTMVPSVLVDSEKGKDLKEGSLDDLIADKDLNQGPLDNVIAGFADLSLDKKI